MVKISRVCEARLKKYFSITEKAFKIAEKNMNKKKGKEAKEILDMVSAYLNDAKYFKKQGHYVNAFACLNYAHGWLDSGSRLGIFKVKNNKLFVIR
jgi:hypothetical protein